MAAASTHGSAPSRTPTRARFMPEQSSYSCSVRDPYRMFAASVDTGLGRCTFTKNTLSRAYESALGKSAASADMPAGRTLRSLSDLRYNL